MRIFDSHAHYDDRAFDGDREEVLDSLVPAGILAVMNAGSDRSSSEAALRLTEQRDFLYGAAGIHPASAEEWAGPEPAAGEAWLTELLSHPKMRAIGEIGLDYHWPEPSRELQKQCFAGQLETARRLGVPVIIHSREAAQDTLAIMKEAGGSELSAVIHCFSYTVETARICLDLGYYIGIGGVLTYANSRKLREVAAYVPADRILLETDCPYLTPVPNRGHRNDSRNLTYVLAALASLRGISTEEAARITWENALRFYRIADSRQEGPHS